MQHFRCITCLARFPQDGRSPSPTEKLGRQQFYVDDATIAEQLNQKPYAHANGKRCVCVCVCVCVWRAAPHSVVLVCVCVCVWMAAPHSVVLVCVCVRV